VLPPINPVTGVIRDIPNNSYKLITRKGVTPAANQSPRVMIITTTIDVPAGSETYEPEDVKAAFSAHFGVGWAEVQDMVDAAMTGVI
jgi:hypothetical protein